MNYALDTNILARSVEDNHPMNASARDAVEHLVNRQELVCVLAQNLYEFWVIATRPQAQNGLGLSAEETLKHFSRFETVFTLKPDTPAVYAEWKTLVTQHAVMGKPAHDALIAAAMKIHGISHLLTFNTGDFKPFSEITVISPTEIQ
jgi:predicted nucleic acid-binding protein